jgi:hypothetical protein
MDSNFRFRARAEPARRCPKDFGSSPSTVRTSAACNRISGPTPDFRSADTGIRRSGRRRPPRCSGYAYHPTARQAAAGLSTGSAPRARIAPVGYGLRSGILGAPARATQAASPLLFGVLMDHMGIGVLAISAGLSLSALFALLLLKARPAAAPVPG